MREERYKDCFHKIVIFQCHKNCQQIASICENKCQVLHSSNNPPSLVHVDVIHNQYNKIKNSIIESIKHYTQKFGRQYQELMKFFQKKYTQSLREMQRELLMELIKKINTNKDVLDKIENERLEKLKCNQIYNFLEETNIQRKLKSAPLSPIYERHLNSLRNRDNNFNLNLLSPPNSRDLQQSVSKTIDQPTSATKNLENISKSDYLDLKRQNQQLKAVIEQLKEFQKSKRQKLSIRTWNVLKVITKKRLKEAKANKQKDAMDATSKPQLSGLAEAKPNQNQGNSDSEDMVDFLKRKEKL